MAYEKNTWARGDVVTSAKLNHMEDGIAGACPLVMGGFALSGGNVVGTGDMTWQEIRDALSAGHRIIVIMHDDNDGVKLAEVTEAYRDDDAYLVTFASGDFECGSSDGYPTTNAPDPIG